MKFLKSIVLSAILITIFSFSALLKLATTPAGRSQAGAAIIPIGSGSATGRQYLHAAGLPATSRRTMMIVTAYCPCKVCCGRYAARITASGHKIRHPGERFVAADRKIPFGTRLVIPGYAGNNPVPVLDRGGKIKGNRLDVYYSNHAEAKEWGVQQLKVVIFKG
jgi:3D (Asp-Asp-Asp) domain-containing protein